MGVWVGDIWLPKFPCCCGKGLGEEFCMRCCCPGGRNCWFCMVGEGEALLELFCWRWA